MKTIILIGHGSLKNASGKAMMRMADKLREEKAAPIVRAGFLNYSQPTLADVIEESVTEGATAITIQPYFLIEGKYVREDLPAEVAAAAARYAHVPFYLGKSFGAHSLMADVAMSRIQVTDPSLGKEGQPSALLFLVHGTPYPEANAPLLRLAGRIHARTDYCRVPVAYLDCNQPTIPEAIESLVSDATQRIVALPYFLQNGRHVREDIPQLLADAARQYPQVEILRAPYLGYDPRLAQVIQDRVAESTNVTSDGTPHVERLANSPAS